MVDVRYVQGKLHTSEFRTAALQDTIRVACVHATLVIAKMLNADERVAQ